MQVYGWLVTDERGNTSIHRSHMQAEIYATSVHTRGGVIDALVKHREALAAVAEAGCRRDSDDTKER